MPQLFPVELAANVQTDVTAGGIAAADVGTYLLNICNPTMTDANVIVHITKGAAASNATRFEPKARVKADGGVVSRWPIPLGQGWKVFAQSSVAGVSVQLIGAQGKI